MLIICSKCNTEKDAENDFYKRANGTFRRECKKCKNEANNLYRINNPEKFTEYNREFQKTEKRKNYLQEYKNNNKEKIKKRAERQYKKVKDSNPEYLWAISTLSRHKNKGIRIDINSQELTDFIKTKDNKCFYCGMEVCWVNNKVNSNSPTIDRINNELFIDLTNINLVCHLCNRTKYTKTHNDFIQYCEYIYNFNKTFEELKKDRKLNQNSNIINTTLLQTWSNNTIECHMEKYVIEFSKKN